MALRVLLLAGIGNDLAPDDSAIAAALAALPEEAVSRLPRISDMQGITLQLVANLLQHPPRLPAPVAADLRQRALAHRAAQLRSHVQIEKVAGVLDEICDRWLVFKGPVLADFVYRIPGRRSYSDVDILIPPGAVRRAIASLTEAGYALGTQNWRLVAERDSRELTFLDGSGSSLDVHWYPLGASRKWPGIRFDTARSLERSRLVTLGRRTQTPLTVRTFAPADQLVHLAAHAVLSGMGPLRYALDLEQALLHDPPSAAELTMVLDETAAALPLRVALERAASALPRIRESFPSALGKPGPWPTVTRVFDKWKPPQSSHERAPLDFLLSSTRETSLESFKAVGREILPRIAALAHPKAAAGRLLSGAQEGFPTASFMQPVDEGYRERVLGALDA